MTGLLDLIEDHRAAVQYDLLRHGYRLQWLGTRRLPWGDALAIISQQPPQTSAVFRATHPADYDRTRESQILELLSVLVAHVNVRLASGMPVYNVRPSSQRPRFPDAFEDLVGKENHADEDEILAGIMELERFLGGG